MEPNMQLKYQCFQIRGFVQGMGKCIMNQDVDASKLLPELASIQLTIIKGFIWLHAGSADPVCFRVRKLQRCEEERQGASRLNVGVLGDRCCKLL